MILFVRLNNYTAKESCTVKTVWLQADARSKKATALGNAVSEKFFCSLKS